MSDINKELQKLLDLNKPSKSFKEDIKEDYRLPLQNDISEAFAKRPNFRYGGSLAKETANKNSCDVDLLCYFDDNCNLSLKEIYRKVQNSLVNKNYIFTTKNSAICIKGDQNGIWDISVDVVPGKYSSNEKTGDVYLYCNKTDSNLKSNPDAQIEHIKQSKMKDVIRIIKLFRENHKFEYRSFYLEIFATDIIEPLVKDDNTLFEKLIEYCKHFNEIGNVNVHDPANAHNEIKFIHDETEFCIIRNKMKELYEVLLTDDSILIIDYLNNSLNKDINTLIENSYARNAANHSKLLNLNVLSPLLSLTCSIKGTQNSILSNEIVEKDKYLIFKVAKSTIYNQYIFKFIVSNAGYEARKSKQLRGEDILPNVDTKSLTTEGREERTLYNGNHYVQAIAISPGKPTLYSKPFIVKIRDF